MMVLMNEERVVMVTVSLRWQPLFLQFAGKSHHWTQCSVDTHSLRPWTSLEIPGQHISCNDDDEVMMMMTMVIGGGGDEDGDDILEKYLLVCCGNLLMTDNCNGFFN